MTGILENLVHTLNGLGSTSFSLFTSFITFNYYLGDLLFNLLKSIVSTCMEILVTFMMAIRIMLEDLVVFLQELKESVFSFLHVIFHCLEISSQFLQEICDGTVNFVSSIFTNISNILFLCYVSLAHCFNNVRFIFDLLGRSIILLIKLIPSTFTVLFLASKSLLKSSVQTAQDISTSFSKLVTEASPELYLGMVVGTISSIVVTKLAVTTIRERNITWNWLFTTFIRLLCMVYVSVFRLIARFFGLIFTVAETTISNLRVPMFAHAGDSDDEEEDRENLVGAVEDSDDEENEKRDIKRRNFELLIEKTTKRQESRRDSSDSVEDQLLREMEREREDKLCVICQDQEKCIMILPCRHLCICEKCKVPLKTHRNTCPICRKQVKQMIKAYL